MQFPRMFGSIDAVKRLVPSMPSMPSMPKMPGLPGVPKLRVPSVPGLSKLPSLPRIPKGSLPKLKRDANSGTASLPSGDGEGPTTSVAEVAADTTVASLARDQGDKKPGSKLGFLKALGGMMPKPRIGGKAKEDRPSQVEVTVAAVAAPIEGGTEQPDAPVDAMPSPEAVLEADQPADDVAEPEVEPELSPAEMGLPDPDADAGSFTLDFGDADQMVPEPAVSGSQKPPMAVPITQSPGSQEDATASIAPVPTPEAAEGEEKAEGTEGDDDSMFADDDLMTLFADEDGAIATPLQKLAKIAPEVDVNTLLLECVDIRDRLEANRPDRVDQEAVQQPV